MFIPKTRKKTKYCDRIVRDGKTCKQIAPYLNRKERASADRVISEFNRVNDMLLHRLERAEYDKKSSPIDLTRKEYYQWLDTATDARDRYLKGELSEEEWAVLPALPAGLSHEEQLALRAALELLDAEERRIVLLHAVTGWKHREIASLLELPLPTVLSKYHRALKKLRKQLEGENVQ